MLIRLVTFLLSASFCAAPALAADKPGALPVPVAAIVDVQRILDDSMAATSVRKQIEAQRAKFQSEIQKEENDLRQAEQDLTKARNELTPDIYADREQQLRQRFLAVERHVQARRKALEQTLADSMNTVRKNLLDVVDMVAHEHGANLVMVKELVVWTDKSLDVTDEVLNRLNQKLPQVSVKIVADDKQ